MWGGGAWQGVWFCGSGCVGVSVCTLYGHVYTHTCATPTNTHTCPPTHKHEHTNALQVQAAGITISPLAPRFSPPTLPPGASPECLVTLVLNVDPGGWLSPSCWVGRCLPAWLRLAWAEPFVLSVIALRDKVEQARFAVQPISLVEGGGSIVVGGEGGKEEVEGVVSLAAQPSFLIPRCVCCL